MGAAPQARERSLEAPAQGRGFAASGHRIGMGLLLLVGAVLILFGVGDMRRGMDADPAIANAYLGTDWEIVKAESPAFARLIDLQTRAGGAHLIVFGVMTATVVLTAFRRGERWAWYLMWVLPLWAASVFLLNFLGERQPNMPPPPPMLSAPIFTTVLALALGLSAPAFFGRRA